MSDILQPPSKADWDHVMPQLLALLDHGKLSKDIADQLNRENATTIFTLQSVVRKRKQLFERARTIRRRHGDAVPAGYCPKQNSIWNNPPELVPHLRQLWSEGHSVLNMTNELNRCHGHSFSPNAIIGKVHRLGLDNRPSPIKRETIWTEQMRERCRVLLVEHGHMLGVVASKLSREFGVAVTESMVSDWLKRQKNQQAKHALPGPTLPPLASLQTMPKPHSISLPTRVSPKLIPTRPKITASSISNVVRLPVYGRIAPCCWPIGMPRTEGFRFCEEPSEPGKVYCVDHAKIAYVRTRDRQEDAA